MLNPKTAGVPVEQFPYVYCELIAFACSMLSQHTLLHELRMTSSHSKFDRNGVIMPSANSALKSMPLCGDLMFFRKFTLLQFSGHVDRGLIMVRISLA